ncbi:MAG: nickel-dependent lactate racemase [Candidatus Bathyarchaeota archaeon]|nr:MAG: nickel-dependent lactate racemase [Candidatus Bathyarchaeota archaeon]
MLGKAYYEGKEIHFELPQQWNLLVQAEPQGVLGLDDIDGSIREAFKSPIGMPSFPEQSLIDKKIAIISDDQTRPTPAEDILPPLLDQFNKLGVGDQDVDLVVGRGTHRLPDRVDLERKLGKEVLDRVRVSVHDADDDAGLAFMGETSRGTPLWVNKLVAKADFVVGFGTVAPHYFAGYSGGPKIILPGVCGRETIIKNHVMAADPKSVQGIRKSNPIWEDMLEAARIVGLDAKLDFVLTPDKKVYRMFFGDVELSQDRAVETFTKVYGVSIPKMVDVAITSGYPLEANLIQSSKAIMSANSITKKGGSIILSSACYDGPGPMFYETLCQKPDPGEVIRWIGEGKASPTGGPMASRLRSLLKNKRLVVVTQGIAEEKIRDMEMVPARDLSEAIEEESRRRKQADVAVLPIGGASFPYIA